MSEKIKSELPVSKESPRESTTESAGPTVCVDCSGTFAAGLTGLPGTTDEEEGRRGAEGD